MGMMQRMRWQGGDEEDNGGGARQRVRLEGARMKKSACAMSIVFFTVYCIAHALLLKCPSQRKR